MTAMSEEEAVAVLARAAVASVAFDLVTSDRDEWEKYAPDIAGADWDAVCDQIRALIAGLDPSDAEYKQAHETLDQADPPTTEQVHRAIAFGEDL